MTRAPFLSSWQKMRKELKAFVAPSLAGRVDYFFTRYRDAAGDGRVEIQIDGKAVTNFGDLKWFNACTAGWNPETRQCAHSADYDPKNATFRPYDFADAAGWYLNRPIAESLAGVECEDKSNPMLLTANTGTLRRCLALLDKRVGKRTLRRLSSGMEEAPPIVRYFYALRCEAEGIKVEVDVPESLIS